MNRRRVSLGLLIAMSVVLAACAGGGQQAPATTTTSTATSTTTPPSSAAPTQKSVNPTGGNLFTPGITAPAGPSVAPGQHPGINGVP
jgi:hypothetical protein